MSTPAAAALADTVSAPSSLPPAPGGRPVDDRTAWSLLDDPQEWTSFSRPVPDQPSCWESNVVFEGMHCAACALTIEDAVRAVPGVQSVTVGAASHRGRIVWSDQAVRPSDWMAAAERVGYRPLPAGDAFASERRRAETRTMIWRWGVAGLCMMQVMMYAWPAYVAEPGDMSRDMDLLLRWASWVLSIPVLMFSCKPFFANAWRDLRQRSISMDLPVALGMIITFIVSSLGTFEPEGIFGKEVFFDSFTMFVFFLLTGRWLELRMRDRTAGALEALMNRLPDSVERRRPDGGFERVAARRIAVGDEVRVLAGEAFPGDGTVTEGATHVDESLLTGESRPLARGEGSTVIAGSHNLGAPVLVRIERTGDQTRFAQIVSLMEGASSSKPDIAQLADRMARPFLIAVLVCAAGAAAFWWGHDPGHALMVAVAVLIVTCPCALSLATPAAMLAGAGTLARGGVLVRRLHALEVLATVDTVVFDKTGTLTRDAFALGTVTTRTGCSPQQALQMAAALARRSLHPVSRALVRAAGDDVAWVTDAVQEHAGAGVQGLVRRADGAQTAEPASMRLGSARFCGVDVPPTDSLHACLADEDGWLATFELLEDLRDDAAASVKALAAQGIEVQLLSGDVAPAVARVARQVGIDQDHARGGCTPQDKLDFLRAAQARGRRVAMVGDGLNDGPVLAGAHASFAFGQSVPLTQARSDFVVLGERLKTIGDSVHLARRTMGIVRQNLIWAAAYNAVCVPLAVVGWLPAWLAGLGMAASSLFVVVNALRLSARTSDPARA
jgi:Cu2+-exporting ATPase